MSSREEFETWYLSVHGEEARKWALRRYQQGDYRGNLAQSYWLAWQASRQALEIKLPDDGIQDCERDWGARCKDTFDCGYNYACEQHEKAIEAAGVRGKPCS